MKSFSRKETVTIEEWEEFERWKRCSSDLEADIMEAYRGWKDHLSFLKEEGFILSEDDYIQDLNSAVKRMALGVYAIRTGKRMPKDYYLDVEEDKPQAKMLCEITIIDISGDGDEICF